jgi:hypothetical protein
VNKRNLAIGVGLAILVGYWILRDGEEPPAPGPAEVQKEQGGQAPRWTSPTPVPPAPPPAFVPSYPGRAGPYSQAPLGAYPPEETFRFRPLGERERRRIEEQARGPYGPSYPSAGDYWSPQRQPGGASPPTYGVDPAIQEPWMREGGGRGWGTEGYGFRQPELPRQDGTLWQGPYATPTQPEDWLPQDPGLFQEPNQWGSIPPERTPPAYRMYPSLDAHRDRRLTAR